MAFVIDGKAKSATAGITASTTQSQGNGLLSSEVNEIATVGNTDDTVTLPAASPGLEVTVINNGANTLQIFPASGDDLGAGANNSEQLAINESVEYVAIDSTTWVKEATTGIIHAEMFDTDNTDAYVINDVGSDQQGYHTNGMAAGDLAGWTFDAGGAGTSHAIASVADGADSGVDIAVTTSDAHGVVAGDIVTHSNVTVAAYAGYFVVKAKISDTVYEVAAVDGGTATGTMDQPATLKANTGSGGQYLASWAASASAVGANDNFDFALHTQATHIGSTNTRRFFSANDVGSISGVSIITVADGDQVSFMIVNASDAGNIIMRDFTLVLVRL